MNRLTCVRFPLGVLTVSFYKTWMYNFIFYYYTPYTHYTNYFTGSCSTGDLRIAGLCQTQGSFCSVQLFGAGAHKVQWCSEGILQSISSKNVSWMSSHGFRDDSTARHRQWRLRFVTGNCLVCSGSTPVLSFCIDRHWLEVFRMCTCFDVGILR